MADANIKRITILREDLPGIDNDNFAYNVRFRILSNDKNLTSAWSNFYNVSASLQRVGNPLNYTYAVESVNTATGTKNLVRLNWEPRARLKIPRYDLFIARDIVNAVQSAGVISAGATSFNIEEEDQELEVGMLIVGNDLAAGTHITAINGTEITFSPASTGNIPDGREFKFYGVQNIYITGNSETDRLESGEYIFYGENQLRPGQIITIRDSATTEFNGTFKVLEQDLTSTQFRVKIFKDGPDGFFPPSGTAIAYTYQYYATTTENSYTFERRNYEHFFILRGQLDGYPKVSKDKLLLFQTVEIDVT